jgi:hypothetical protein
MALWVCIQFRNVTNDYFYFRVMYLSSRKKTGGWRSLPLFAQSVGSKGERGYRERKHCDADCGNAKHSFVEIVCASIRRT